jgi:acyl-CoA dehydrogenase
MANELEHVLGAGLVRLFARHGAHAAKAPAQWHGELWDSLVEMGITAMLANEARGGASATWSEVFWVLQLAGQHFIPLPIAENMVAGKILESAGIAMPKGFCGVAAYHSGQWTFEGSVARFTGDLIGVPWGRYADHIACSIADGNSFRVCMLSRADSRISEASNPAGEPRDRMTFVGGVAVSGLSDAAEASHLRDFCALARIAQIAGCMAAALERCVSYSGQRHQFGRPLSQFQAVQQQLAVLTGETAAVICAARAAFRAADSREPGFQIAAAKLRANGAIGIATAIAHQIHGALGYTEECGLQLATGRLWSWRTEFGNDRYWSERLGAAVAHRGSDVFWADLTARDDAVQEHGVEQK